MRRSKTPKVPFKQKVSHLYCESCQVSRHQGGIVLENSNGTYDFPAATVASLLLGPGTSISQAAVALLADVDCVLAWTGQDGVRLYAFGVNPQGKAERAIVQAKAVSDPYSRMVVAKRLMSKRFDLPLGEVKSLKQIRGFEGSRVREQYREAADAHGVEWTRRATRVQRWEEMDVANRALSAANACLNALCACAILSLGYVPSLGFIHTGQRFSFVYDVADLYKAELSIPVAFEEAAKDPNDVERRVRHRMREEFRRRGFLARITKDLDELFAPIPKRSPGKQKAELEQWYSS